MESLQRLDTASTDTFPSSARNSYASATDSNPPSARNSYESISDINTELTRTSYSSIPDYLNRVASFSRTSDSYIPNSIESSTVSSRDSSPNSLTRWKESPMVVQNSPKTTSRRQSQSNSNAGEKDGPLALKELQNVKQVLCVAFGAFDRYYISWEDNDGEFHQERNKLPGSLNNWLFPPDGQSRDIPTLQVSFGSNDDFFASDQDGKLTSRDEVPLVERKAPAPRMAEVARGLIRRKAHTISSPKVPEDLRGKLDDEPLLPKLERRRTFLEGQASPNIDTRQRTVPLNLSLHGRRRLRGESVGRDDRSIPLNMWLHSRRESRNTMTKIEERNIFHPTFGHVSPGLNTKEELAKAEKIKSTSKVEQQVPVSESRQQLPEAEPTKIISPHVQPQLQRLDIRSEALQLGQQKGTPNDKPHSPWPERKTILMNREKDLLDQPVKLAAKPAYVDASAQTESLGNDIFPQLGPSSVPRSMPNIPFPPRHSVAIGFMADFCRGQYRLGDALRFV